MWKGGMAMGELTVDAEVCNLDEVLRFVADGLAAAGCGAKPLTQAMVAAEEAFVNIARYAYAPQSGKASVRFSTAGGEYAVIEFEDGGKPYNPAAREAPDIAASAEKREVGGLGVFMVKKLMDGVEYRREEGKNILTLKKRLK
jgi:anti-sigma regulatory factor (Ser/Thr protein kinase)